MLAESAERGKEKQRGEEQKINSHRHATLHQDCYCPEREKGGMERGRGYFTLVESPRKTEKDRPLVRERASEGRDVNERKDVFDVTRETEREDGQRGR